MFGHGRQNNLMRKALYQLETSKKYVLEPVITDILVSYLDKVSQD